MGLRTQLALIGLITLTLPWAGCQYLRETEEALRQGQLTMLLTTGESIAALLGDRPSLFPDSAGHSDARTLYAHDIGNTPTLDGFADDWTLPPRAAPLLIGDVMRLLIGRTSQHLYLHMDVTAAGDAEGKRIEIAAGDGEGGDAVYRFEPVAPGPLPATRRGAEGRLISELRVQGWWVPTTDGFDLEARLPLDLIAGELGVRVLERSSAGFDAIAVTHEAGAPGRLAVPSRELARILENYSRPGLELEVADAEGWRLAAAGSSRVRQAVDRPTMASRVYRALLGGDTPLLPIDPGRGKIILPWLDTALSGDATADWRLAPDSGLAVVSAATPIRHDGRIIGAIIMQESSAAILTLTNRALTRLTTLTLIATLTVALALLGYATWLSLRISRLSRAADRAIGSGGRISAGLPSRDAADELGDLSRSFSRLLDRVQETNDYLRTLGARLSHELRTPLAVVTSSLDNLESVGIAGDQRDYALRARDGAQRLQTILNSMSEASRTEQAVTGADIERFDLVAVLTSAAGGYADAYPEHRFRLRCDAAAVMVVGAPELLVQMLDKLVANAVEFSAPASLIELGLEVVADRACLTVSNPGPLLPDSMREQIFDSLVSLRERKSGSHLGLGLYIARLIAESHGGSISAANREDETGVIFTVELPLAAHTLR